RMLTKSPKQITPGLGLISGLLFSSIILVTAATDELASENTGVGFYYDALRIAVVKVSNCNA
ncbi:MAG: hypothetical protein ACRCUE_20665, partial [Bosea sp. (in: a-proteobacteria)]